MEFQLKHVTLQSCGSKATFAVGNTEARTPTHAKHAAGYRRAFFAPSGLTLASFSDNGCTSCILVAALGPIALIKGSLGGDLLATVHRQTDNADIAIWNTSDLTQVRKTACHEQPLDIAFSPDGTCLLVLTPKMLCCYKTSSGKICYSQSIREPAHLICYAEQTTSFVLGGVHHLSMWSVTGTASSPKVQKMHFKLGAHAARSSFVDIMSCHSKSSNAAYTMLALASDGKMVQFQHGKETIDRIIQTRVPQASAFAMPCDSLLVVAGSGGMVKLMDTERWNVIATLPLPPNFPTNSPRHGIASPRQRNDVHCAATAVLADGPQGVVVQYANNSLCCWNWQNLPKANAQWEVLGHLGAIVTLCAPPQSFNSKPTSEVYTAIYADGSARVWQQHGSGTAQLQMTLRPEQATAQAAITHDVGVSASACPVAAMSVSGQMLAIGEPSGSVSVFILPSPTKCRLGISHDGRVSSLAWGEACDVQFLASGGIDGLVHLHCIRGDRILPLQTVQAQSAVTSMAFLHANACPVTLIVGDESGTCTFWVQQKDDFVSSHQLQLQELFGCLEACPIECAQAVPCQRGVALLSRNSHLALVEAASGRMVQHVRLQHSSPPTCLHSAGSVVTCGHEDGSVSVLDIISGDGLGVLRSHSDSVSGCFLDVHRLELTSAGQDGCIHTWDVSAIASRIQHIDPALGVATVRKGSDNFRRPKRRPSSGPLQDLQNVIAARYDDEPELAPLPSHLISPRQAKITGTRLGDALTASMPVLREGKGHQQTPSVVKSLSQFSCGENEARTSCSALLSWAQRRPALGRRPRGSSMSAFRHSIAGHPDAELRREALQRQRDHKLWESNNVTLLEQLRHELEACPVRRGSLHRRSMSHLELKASIPDQLQLNLSTVLSPIRQSISESVSTARMSQCLRTSSMSFRRSVSAPPADDSPRSSRPRKDGFASTVPPSGRTVHGVDESFSSLTLPSPTTLARDLQNVGGFMNTEEQDILSKTPILTPPVISESPRDDTIRSDVKRGFSWQNNGMFKDGPCADTSASADPACQSWDEVAQPLFGVSPRSEVLNECRPAPAPVLTRMICNHGESAPEGQMRSHVAHPPSGFSVDAATTSLGMIASRSSMIAAGGAATSGLVSVASPQPTVELDDPDLGAAVMNNAIMQTVVRRDTPDSAVMCGAQEAVEPITPAGAAVSHRRSDTLASATSSPPSRCTPQASTFPSLDQCERSPGQSYSARRRIPRRPIRCRADVRHGLDSLDTPLSSLASLSSASDLRPASALQHFVSNAAQESPENPERTFELRMSSGAIPKPKASMWRSTPVLEQVELASDQRHAADIGQATQLGAMCQLETAACTGKRNAAACGPPKPSQGRPHNRLEWPAGSEAHTAAPSPSRICSEMTIRSTSASEVFATPCSVAAAIDAAFSSALRMEVQQVIQLSVDRGWDYHAKEFRQALADKLSQESKRLAAVAANLCGGGTVQYDNTEHPAGVSRIFGQLQLLKSRVSTHQ